MNAATALTDEDAPGFGAALSLRLADLRRRNVAVGVREESEAHALAAELLARRVVKDFGEFEPYLAALLCRSEADYEAFHGREERIDPPPVSPDVPAPTKMARFRAGARRLVRNWRSWAVLAAMVFAVLAFMLLQPDPVAIDEPPPDPVVTPPPPELAAGPEPEEAPAAPVGETGLARQTVMRILIAGDRFHGAPTLAELSGALRSTLGHTPAELSLMLSRYSGATQGHALDLYGVTGRPAWAPRLALALDNIERPADAMALAAYAIPEDRAAPLAQVVAGVKSDLRNRERVRRLKSSVNSVSEEYSIEFMEESQENFTDKNIEDTISENKELYEEENFYNPFDSDESRKKFRSSIERYRDSLGVLSGDFDKKILLNDESNIVASLASIEGTDPEATTRLLALIDPAAAIATRRAEAAQTIPLAPLAAGLAPPILFLLWFGWRLERRRAQLNRRRPEVAPLHDCYILDAAARAERWTRREHDAARILQTRDVQPVDRLDVPQTIAATLRGGGMIVEPRYQVLRPAPEYLVLIERRGPGDQEAEHLRQLVEPFRTHHVAGFTVYWVQGSLGSVIPERGGAALPMATLRLRHPDHRLILLGSGRIWAGSDRAGPPPETLALRAWERRAMLTPVPVSDWGATEPRLADALDMVVGRATTEGMAHIGAYLGLEDRPVAAGPLGTGDQGARVVPPLIRLNRHEMLDETPPDRARRAAIVSALHGYLDGKGFRWLAALCVYPATQWDLTFYLGRERTYRADDPLYGDDADSDRRLGQLAQLPWLQAGHIPKWLRQALIAELSPEEAGMVYATLCDVLERARHDDGTREPDLRLRIGRNRPVDPLADAALEDTVMLDFLDRGARGDFVLPSGFEPLKDARPRVLARQPGVRRMAAGAAALAAAGAWVAPQGPAVPTGGWLPLLVLFAGAAAIALALMPPRDQSAAGGAVP